MPSRSRKRAKLMSRVQMTIGMYGITSISVSGAGMRVSLNKRGAGASVTLPGGLRYEQRLGLPKRKRR